MDATLDSLVEEMRGFLIRALPHLEDKLRALSSDADLWVVIDSLLVLDLLTYLEKTVPCAIEPLDVTPENLGTLAAIASLASRRRVSSR